MQASELKEVFEEVNGKKDCLQRCVTGMAGAFKKSQISCQLRAMGLKRNRLTEDQVRTSAQHSKCDSDMYVRNISVCRYVSKCSRRFDQLVHVGLLAVTEVTVLRVCCWMQCGVVDQCNMPSTIRACSKAKTRATCYD